ncbi:hypothetical protein BH24ACT3_BH24ACT3_13770 [soil metagenome]
MAARRYGTGVGGPGVVAAAVVAGYLLGSIPVAVLYGRARGFDPRAVGDHNPGYWNTRAQVGSRSAAPVFVGDTAKGFAAGGLGVLLAGDTWGIAYAAVAAAMVGHAYPVFARFRGGRSVLTFAGGMLAVSPLAAAVAVLACVAVSVATRRFAVCARVGVFGFPLVQLVVEPVTRVAGTGALLTIIGLRFALAVADRRQRGPDRSAG